MNRERFNFRQILFISSTSLLPMLFSSGSFAQQEEHVRDLALKLLGKHVFYDTELSNPKGNQGCVSCHDPAAGGSSPFSDINATTVVIPGANGNVGTRRTITNMYASFVPPFSPDCKPNTLLSPYCGGNFWDGRSEGKIPDFATDGTFPAPHLDAEVFYNIESPKITAYSKYFGPTSDQALNPFPSIAEQNITEQDTCKRVAAAEYRTLYKVAFGKEIDCGYTEVSPYVYPGFTGYNISFRRVMLAVAAFQHSWETNSFTSKRDMALRSELACIEPGHAEFYDMEFCEELAYAIMESGNGKSEAGKFPLLMLTEAENFGHDIFYNVPHFNPAFGVSNPDPSIPAGACAFCHSNTPTTPVFAPPFFSIDDDGSELLQTYADHAYHNIGVPYNPEIPVLEGSDTGLNRTHMPAVPNGGFRSPSLRNLFKKLSPDFTKAYMHNGFFKSVETVVNFYNTASVKPVCPTPMAPEKLTEAYALANNCWPAPEFSNNLTRGTLIGNLGMTSSDEAALVSYLKTLDDYHTAEPPFIFERRAFLPPLMSIGGNYRPRPASPAVTLFSYEGEWLIRECNKISLGDGVTPISVPEGSGCNMTSILEVVQGIR
ncbi:cytochrome c peroxidase [Microbulbifer bruguierae]|uniref:Cytochrome c peroxidase n=1 Tax=Microbulbifer bruguierae TaxID=3029061 RepID=A0ABY8NDR3_9GAMM|nr:cytochrome c peroxidase [Microbulbifer bruguierae]WGL16222.1 cytochrome c peroxidase [Microbulbifer bruguierae]